jgi:Ner family transcriptional regulator
LAENSDWNRADIAAALKKRGYTQAGLSIANGYDLTAVGKALQRPWPALERIIADALGVTLR